jgi:Skp family chaperone for outer membrane proteins
MNYIKSVMFILVGIFTFVSCDDAKDAELEIGETQFTVAINDDMDDLESTMKDFGDRIDKEIADINAKMEDASEEIKADLKAEREEWNEARKQLDEKMKKLRKNTKENWTEFKSDVQNWFEDVEKEFGS